MFKKIPPALVLWLIAPIFGELFSGSSPLNEYINPITFITLGLLYGCGAIIVRELVIRWQKGWLGLLLLGAAYGIYEEGLLVQSFFDPGWVDLGVLAVYGRALGVNWVWAEHLTIFHALISIAASIAFVEILYPDRRAASWVESRRWWIANWFGFLFVLVLWRMLAKYDAGIWNVISVLAILALGLLARFIPARILAPREKTPPKPWRFWLIGFLGWFIQFIIVYNGSEKGTTPFPITMLVLAIFDLFLLWIILWMNGNGAAWDDRHRLALINGALSLFLIFVPLTSGAQMPIIYVTNPIFLIGLWWVYRGVNRRVSQAQPQTV
jgi:hypothetical protein